jgi:glucan 1,3-beta-glucosidase
MWPSHSLLLCTSAALALAAVPSVLAQQQQVTPITLHGINYNTRQGPDWDPNKCKNATQVYQELELVSKITSRVRILSCSDCLQGPVVLAAAKELGLQMWFGLWVSDDEDVFEQELTCLTQIVKEFDDVVLGVSVGSEAVYRGEITAAQSVAYLQATKQVMSDAGRDDLAVAICDVDDTYETYPRLMQATDLVLANAFPFWEAVDIDDAVEYLVNEKLVGGWDVATSFNKEFILGETGWASAGSADAASEASPENQAQYFRDFYCTVDRQEKWKYFWFGAFDTAWRIQQEGDDESVEGHFGIWYANMTMKEHFAKMRFTCNGGSDEVYAFALDAPATGPTAAPPSSPTAVQANPTAAPRVVEPTLSPKPTPALTPASCASNPQCKDLGLTGECCPTVDDIFLVCCENIPTQSPNATTSPAAITSPAPATRDLTPSPAAAGGESPSASPLPEIPAIDPTVPSSPSAIPAIDPTAPSASEIPAIDPTAPSASEIPAAPSSSSGVPIPVDEPTADGFGSDAPSAVPTYEGGGTDRGDGSPTVPPTFVVSQAPTPTDATLPGSTSGAADLLAASGKKMQHFAVLGGHVAAVVLGCYLWQ